MATPKYKVYDKYGEYQASCREIEGAACLMGFYGTGSQIRFGHSLVVWREGMPGFKHEDRDGEAYNSYDHVAEVVNARVSEHFRAVKAKYEEQRNG